jgi:hypothetical protein
MDRRARAIILAQQTLIEDFANTRASDTLSMQIGIREQSSGLFIKIKFLLGTKPVLSYTISHDVRIQYRRPHPNEGIWNYGSKITELIARMNIPRSLMIVLYHKNVLPDELAEFGHVKIRIAHNIHITDNGRYGMVITDDMCVAIFDAVLANVPNIRFEEVFDFPDEN